MRTRSRTGLLATAMVVACLVAAGPAGADWQVVGGGPVASGTSSMSPGAFGFRTYDMKRIDGRLYVAWGQDGKVRVSRLAEDASGWEPVGGVVNADPAHEAREPSLATAPDGTPWIAWTERDDVGASQIRAARYDASRDRWIEPDGRDWEINELDPGYEFEAAVFSGSDPRITFLGERPYITYMQDNPDEFNIEVVRLAADGNSWERIARYVGDDIPRDADAAVIGGLLHVGLTASFDHPIAVRLNQDGAWARVGGELGEDQPDEYGYARTGLFRQLAGFNGEPYVLWKTSDYYSSYLVNVSRIVDGKWQVVGGSVGSGGAASLRAIGGRLWVAWVDGQAPHDLHVSRLADDGSAWTDSGAIAGTPADQAAILSSLDGVPYVAWVRTDGTTNELVIERLDGAPAPLAADEDEGSGPGTDPDVNAEPILPPDDDPPHPTPHATCAVKMPGTAGPDRLVAAPHTSTAIRGRAGDDREIGSAKTDCLYGNGGDDVLRGRDGEDRLYGGIGADQLFGGPDEDKLTGGAGPDVLNGGLGWDVFRGGPGNDTILAADGRGEDVWCGPGNDTANLDRYDRPHGCERVTIAKR